MKTNLKRWVAVSAKGPVMSDGPDDKMEVLYWSNDLGWTPDLSLAAVYYDDEKDLCLLPMGGKWHDITKEG